MPNAILLMFFVVARLLPLAIMLPSAFTAARSLRWSLLLLILLSLIVIPTQFDSTKVSELTAPAGVETPEVAVGLLRELLLGLAIGFGFTVVLGGLQLTAVALGQMTGLTGLTASASSGSGLQRYFGLLSLSLFLVSGGHRQLVSVLLDSFIWLPPGESLPGVEPAPLMASLLSDSFELGIRAGAPVAFCLIVASLMVALLSRNGSMLGGFGVNVALSLIVMLLVSWVTLESTATLFQQAWSDGLTQLVQVLQSD